jgi:hypothetical protein
MTRQPLTLRESRAYATLAAAVSLTASAAAGAGASATAGPATGLAVGGLAALLTTWGALSAVRLLVTCPREPGST